MKALESWSNAPPLIIKFICPCMLQIIIFIYKLNILKSWRQASYLFRARHKNKALLSTVNDISFEQETALDNNIED